MNNLNSSISDDSWKQCADWLIRCGAIDPTQQSAIENSSLLEFAQNLRDGVVLCKGLHRLQKGSVDMKEVSLRPQLSQFLCIKNITLVLLACQNTFGIDRSLLFDADDLFKVKDFGKILQVLAIVSQSPAALKTGIRGFDYVEKEQPTPDYYNEIYRNLAEEAEEHDLAEDDHNGLCEDDRDQIYDHIVTRKTKPQQPDDFKPRDTREHCIKELIDTERNYVEALNMMLKNFTAPLRKVFTPSDFEAVFINLEELAEIHTAFQSELSKAARLSVSTFPSSNSASPSSPQPIYIGDVFIRWKYKFTAYSSYCAKLTSAVNRIERLISSDANTKARIVECEKEANGGKFRLQDLLSVPMQRVLKYHLLLETLSKHTPSIHEERDSLERALEAMKDLSLFINEAKRDYETFSAINEIERSIGELHMPKNTEMADYGRLLKDGEIKISSHDNKKLKQRYVFVFDKVLLICKSVKTNSYIYKSALALTEYKLEDGGNFTGTHKSLLKSSPKWSHFFSLVHERMENVFSLCTKSVEMKENWMKAIRMAHDNVIPQSTRNSDHSFQMHTFPSPTECSRCGKLLRGLRFQGYICQRQDCDVAVHKECVTEYYGCGKPEPPPRPKSFPARAQSINCHDSQGSPLFCAVAAFHGNGGGPQVIEFEKNDIVEVKETETGIQGWWKGLVLRTGRVGLFPAEYVRRSSTAFTGPWHRTWNQRASHSLVDPASSIMADYNRRPPLRNMLASSPSAVSHLSSISSQVHGANGHASGGGSPQLTPSASFSSSPSPSQRQVVPCQPSPSHHHPQLHRQQRESLRSEPGDAGSVAHLGRSASSVSSTCSVWSGTKGGVGDQSGGSGRVWSGVVTEDHYVNIDLQHYPWYGGYLDRVMAEKLLHHFANGTYLVRCSPKLNQYVISISYDNDVKHVKIEHGDQGYYLDTSQFFNSIVELIDFYCQNSLQESFQALDTTLKAPIKMAYVGCAFAMHNFEGTAPNMISLRKGDFLLIISKNGGDRGWWKGKIDGKIGYFPLAYVQETDQVAPASLSEIISRAQASGLVVSDLHPASFGAPVPASALPIGNGGNPHAGAALIGRPLSIPGDVVGEAQVFSEKRTLSMPPINSDDS